MVLWHSASFFFSTGGFCSGAAAHAPTLATHGKHWTCGITRPRTTIMATSENDSSAVDPMDNLPQWMHDLRNTDIDSSSGDDNDARMRFLQKMLMRTLDARVKMEHERNDLIAFRDHVEDRISELQRAEQRVSKADAAWAGRALSVQPGGDA